MRKPVPRQAPNRPVIGRPQPSGQLGIAPELLHQRHHVGDAPVLVRDAVVVEPDDVDELRVDALPGRGHAHELVLVRAGHARPHDDLVAVDQHILGVDPAI